MPDSKFTRTRTTTTRARELRQTTSKTEARLWRHLRDAQTGAPFRRQHPIGKYFADYCCVPLKLVVEVDGDGHEWKRDTMRDHVMEKLGFEVMRFSVQEVDRSVRQVVDAIHAAVQMKLMALEAEKGPPPNLPLSGGGTQSHKRQRRQRTSSP